MKILLALCLVATVAQTLVVDWTTVDKSQIVPEEFKNISKYIPRTQPSRITGGEEAIPGEFPYQVALRISIPQGTAFCGGSIIHEKWVLTAAHCVETATSVEMIFGAHNITGVDSHQFRTKAKRFVIHEDWDRSAIVNDIALLELVKPLEFSPYIQPIRLPSLSQINVTFAGETAIVSGWGKDSDESTGVSPVLRWTQNPIMHNILCNFFYFFRIIDSKICLDGTGGRSSCNGDSGGPLVTSGSDGNKTTQIGIVSYGPAFGCAVKWPSVYTRVTSYLDWIETNTGGNVSICN